MNCMHGEHTYQAGEKRSEGLKKDVSQFTDTFKFIILTGTGRHFLCLCQ